MTGAATGRPRSAWERQETMASQRPKLSLTPMDLATCWSSRNTGNLPPPQKKKKPMKSKKKKPSLGKCHGEMAVPSLWKGSGNVPREGGNPERHRLKAQRVEKTSHPLVTLQTHREGPFLP